MPTELRFICALDHGIHARPASLLAEALRPFDAQVTLIKESNGRSADLRSVLSVVALDVAKDDACIIQAEGIDAAPAVEAIHPLIQTDVGEPIRSRSSTPLSASGAPRIPAGLRKLGVHCIAGQRMSPGFAQGPVLRVIAARATEQVRHRGAPANERAEVLGAIQEARSVLQSRVQTAPTELERGLLQAHLTILGDPALLQKIEEEVANGASAMAAIHRAGDFFVGTLGAAASKYVRDRAIDVRDVCQQIAERLGSGQTITMAKLVKPSVIAADLLTPRHLMEFDRRMILALVLGRVGATSHTAILARSFGLPALADVDVSDELLIDGQEVIVDADAGFVLPVVNNQVKRYYAIQSRAAERRRRRLEPFIKTPARTRTGTKLEVAANVSTSDQVIGAMEEGAEGIGLFRTEILFLDRSIPPTEHEQFETYRRAIDAAKPHGVIFRTFDIGGDKPAPYLRMPREDNPFLGFRGIRVYEEFTDLLRGQLRALAKASAFGPIKIMAPMVSNMREAEWFRQQVRQVQEELRADGADLDPAMPVGVMIEVVSAAMTIEQIGAIVDFISIGTNDLCQYFFAADRTNSRVAGLCDPLEPAFVRLLTSIVEGARRHGRWVGVCGEMAGDPQNLPLMVGLGVDEISVGPSRVLDLKAALANLDDDECRELLKRVESCRDATAVRALLGTYGSDRTAAAIIEPMLVLSNSDASNKVEVIKELVELATAAGRTGDSRSLEEALWAREDTFSTGLGFGFAVPHCKTTAIQSPTVALVKLNHPVDWNSSDGEPVTVAIMLAIPEMGPATEAARLHMQILAKLARSLMHQTFRDQIAGAETAEAIVAALQAGLAD